MKSADQAVQTSMTELFGSLSPTVDQPLRMLGKDKSKRPVPDSCIIEIKLTLGDGVTPIPGYSFGFLGQEAVTDDEGKAIIRRNC